MGVYTSSTLQLSACGYLSFIIILSDYCLIWLKIEFDSVFGAKMDTLVPHTVWRFNFPKPDTIKLFIELYEKFVRYNGIHLELFYLQLRLVREPFTTPLQTKYDRLLKKSEMTSYRQNQNTIF